MELNKRKGSLYLLLLAVIAFILLYFFNNSYTVESGGTVMDNPWQKHILIYNWDYLRSFFYTLFGVYEEYPWAVHVSYIVIVASCMAMVLLLYVLLWDVYGRRKQEKIYRQLKAAYYEKLKAVAQAEKELSREEIASALELTSDTNFSYAQRIAFIDLLLELRMKVEFTPFTIRNMQNVVYQLGMYDFMENRLISGKDKDKLKVIQAIRILHMNISDSSMTRLINHRNPALRKAARLYYILSNEEDPFRYFENADGHKDFLPWDMLEMHQLFEDCNRTNKQLPSFIPVMNHLQNQSITEFFIRETAYWGTEKEMEHLTGYLDSDKEAYRKVAIESLSLRKTPHTAEQLKEIYYQQPENIRRVILYALFTISAAGSVAFFKAAYEQTSSQLTKRMALQCLWNAGDEGRSVFGELKDTARKNDMILFQHVENRIINREKVSFRNIN